jgi:two-component system, NarL family, response regulator LiaR
MSRTASQPPLRVCFVGQNCLAQAYLHQLLCTDPRLRAFSVSQYARLSPASRKNIVFVIDQCGLEIPLCECLRQLREDCLNAKFLVMDHEKPREEIVRLLFMGAHGYVPHADVSGTLVRAIFFVAAGYFWVVPEVLHNFLSEVGSVLRKDARARQTTTRREDEILELVRRRLSNREIADLLQIRVSTVKFHLSNILSKLNARNRHDLTDTTSSKLWKMQLQ